MFRRNVTVTNSHQLSGKDVKRIIKEVSAVFPSLSEKEVKKIIPSKSEVTVSKMSNKTLVYSVAGGCPVFFEYEDELFPTVYTLWEYPGMLQTVFTYSEVSPKVLAGADLMLPGFIVPPEGLGTFEAGDQSTVSIPENGYPFAVGTMQTGSEEIKEKGLKGKGVKVLHHFPDVLWAMGSKSIPNAGFLQDRIYPAPEKSDGDADVGEVADSLKHADISGAEGEGDNIDRTKAVDTSASTSAPKSAGNMDELVDTCFLKALHTKVADADLPMESSKFFSNCMLASRPAGTDLDIKQSSYKKLSKLIKKMEKRGLITVKQIRKEDYIASVVRDHEIYKAFGEELKAEASAAATAAATATATAEAGDVSPKKPQESKNRIEVHEMFRAPSNLRVVFGEEAVQNKDMLFSRNDARDKLRQYVEAEGLANESAGTALLKANKVLVSGLYGKKEGVTVDSSVEIADVEARLFSKLQLYHKVVCYDKAADRMIEVVRKGAIKNIQVSAEDRHAGRKFITRITHLESFGIDPEEFASALQRLFKTSSSVQKLPGKQESGKEVSLQGNLLNEICKYLENDRGIDASFIQKTSKLKG